jgi:bidirectional [NiFe] hydrogenase diaphorase subunit
LAFHKAVRSHRTGDQDHGSKAQANVQNRTDGQWIVAAQSLLSPDDPHPEGTVPAFTPPPLPSADKRWKIVNGTMRKNGFARNALIETLHTVQSSFGFLDDGAIRFVARSLHVPLSQAYGVVTFYHYFSLKPPGKHTVTICSGTACYIKGSDKLVAEAQERLGILQGQTTKDGRISLMTARCVGACSRAPVMLSDGEVAGEVTREQVLAQLERWAVE